MVKRQLAQRAVDLLHKARMLDPERRIRSGDEVVIPVRADASLAAWAKRLEARLIEAPDAPPREARRTPHEQILTRLEGIVPPERLADVPTKWEKLGRVVVLRLPPSLRPHAREVADAFADALDVDTIVQDPSGVSGEFREMRGELLRGDDPVATHLENGVSYRFDASRIMFSSGNVNERIRMAKVDARGETVVDMFAGVGYFTLPLAVHAGAATVHAIEKNPVAFAYLQENARLNEVEDVVRPWHGDNRDFPHEGIADRVMMGYFPRTARFLPKAMRLVKDEGGAIHYHDTAPADTWRDDMTRRIRDAAMEDQREATVTGARMVKTFSPGMVHAVLDVTVGATARRGAGSSPGEASGAR